VGVARTRGAALALALIAMACTKQIAPQPTRSLSPTQTTASPSPSVIPNAQPALEEVGKFDMPIHVAAPDGDERLFVVEKKGKVLVVAGGKTLVTPALDITDQVSSQGERGLFSIAFPPGQRGEKFAYVSFTDTSGDSRIWEYQFGQDPNVLDPASKRQILFVDQPFANHNGGLIVFDPTGMLIVGLGDGGSGGDPGNRAQNLGELLGKLLRIDPAHPSGGLAYGVPSDNPFVGRPGARGEVWAYGLRNPWRFWFDPKTKDLFVGDVGQNAVEEIDFVPPAAQSGANFGWRAYEGDKRFSDDRIDESRLIRPVLTYPLGDGHCSVTGGHVYRGRVGSLSGFYLYGDFCGGVVAGFKVSGGAAVEKRSFEQLKVPQLVSFGQDSSGETYVVSLQGAVYRVVPKT